MNSQWVRDLLVPGLTWIETEQVHGVELDLVVDKNTHDLRIIGWRKGDGPKTLAEQERMLGESRIKSQVLMTKEELDDNLYKDEFGPRAIAFARKLVEEN